jgi:predicted DNA-binding protein with PD1-like motif
MSDADDGPPRAMRQPGPPAPERILAVAGTGRAVALRLPAGLPLLRAVAEGFAAQGFAGGTVAMDGAALGPFAYVMPALSETGAHAAYYSRSFRPRGVTRLEQGRMTLGRRDGAPFFHCHAIWQDAEGLRSGGHILSEETVLAEAIDLPGFGFQGGVFEANPDPETNFTLFGPVPEGAADQGAPGEGGPAFALRLRPNQDFCGALEGFCAARGIREARLHGGVGSTIGARFTDGQVVRNFATEAFVTRGVVAGGIATVDAALVDYTGALAAGRLVRGGNPVLMTYELVLEVL